jgi:hypothetical protein
MSKKKSNTPEIENIVALEFIEDTIDLEVISSKIIMKGEVNNTKSTLLVYRLPLKLDSEPMDYIALVMTSVEEKEDGSISVAPLALVVTSMDHMSQFSGIREWIHL